MKFAEFPYERPDLQTAMAQLDTLSRSISGAPTAEDAKKAFLSFEEIAEQIGSLSAICYVRHTVNTRDLFLKRKTLFGMKASRCSLTNSWIFTVQCFLVPTVRRWSKILESYCSLKWKLTSNQLTLPSVH